MSVFTFHSSVVVGFLDFVCSLSSVDDARATGSPLAATVPGAPYRWDEARPALLRAELDVWFARAYGLTWNELHYILDSADVPGPDLPGEAFRVLKEKETAKFSEYRPLRLVLEAWEKGRT